MIFMIILAVLQFVIVNAIPYVIFVNIRKSAYDIKEALLVIMAMTITGGAAFILIPNAAVAAIVGNIINTAIMTAASYIQIKLLPLSLVYAIFAIITMLFAANLASVILAITHILTQGRIPIGRDAVTEDMMLSMVYIAIIFVAGYTISRISGHYLHKKISILDDTLKKKLANYLLYGAIITLGVFFTHTFLRYVLTDFAMLTFAYALTLSIGFVYLVFSTFTFADHTRMVIELQHKEESFQDLQAYTQHTDSLSLELNLFRHDHMNLMLGFDQFIESKDWDGLCRYYENYMAEFTAATASKDAFAGKLSNIQIPGVNSILLTKCLQAERQNTGIWVEVSGNISVRDDYAVMDICRVIGILMDNALEACNGVEGAEVRVLAMEDDNDLVFVFENTCHTPPPIHEMFKLGYSTKKGSQGLGLYKVFQMLTSKRNILLDTTFKNGIFTHKLRVIN